MIKGIPQTLAHDTDLDTKYGYSKQVFIGEPKHKDQMKLYSTTCDKLKYNTNNKQRMNECRLATGYFLVN